MRSEVITFKNVSKIFGDDLGLAKMISSIRSRIKKEKNHTKFGFQALEDISFSARRGEKIGLIGPNGAGKSTLLKLIHGLSPQTTGTIDIDGSVGGLLSVMAGFHPNLTCKENVLLNLTFQGFTRKAAFGLIPKVFELAELLGYEEVLFKNLSSGMGIRLGFMSSILAETDIVLLDEVLAVGDKRFRFKCMQMIKDYLEDKTTFFVSHNMSDITDICDRVIVIASGKIVYDGDVEEGIKIYEASQKEHLTNQKTPALENSKLSKEFGKINHFEFHQDDKNTTTIAKGQPAKAHVHLEMLPTEGRPKLFVQLYKFEISTSPTPVGRQVVLLDSKQSDLTWDFDTDSLLPGDYLMEFRLALPNHKAVTAPIQKKFQFTITAPKKEGHSAGLMDLNITQTTSSL